MGLFDRFRKSKKDDREDFDDVEADVDDADDTSDDDVYSDDDDLGETNLGEDVDGTETAEAAEGDDLGDEEEFAKAAPLDRLENGPWDADEDAGEENRVDLGALRVPVRDGMQVRLDAEDKTGRILAVTLVHKGGALQLQAFAAPRGEGLWNTVRKQIVDNVTQKGGTLEELYTELGHELLTKIPARTSDGRAAARVARFAGVDGPRWFIRGVFSGKAITDDEVRAELTALFRGTIVNRGIEAMPPRELLVLSEPKAAAARADDQDAEKDDDINPFERGPEITEVR
ncbi:DUF3710 domain-containing protein [Brevibacterium daeguense]|uniref:DUF3710 domain-containing protein n=1 Tax=Brevibacterium daeguense TaxID=909936 RepID=A0ABP8EMR7_9MICO|nr:DUF3710 domain-containing protein [Brevibacterium daeguense]